MYCVHPIHLEKEHRARAPRLSAVGHISTRTPTLVLGSMDRTIIGEQASPRMPEKMKHSTLSTCMAAISDVIGHEHVTESTGDLLWCSASLDPEGDVPAAAAVAPASVAEVQAVVRLANRYGVPIYTVSGGKQHGLGMATAVDRGNVIMDLRRLNSILSVDTELAYAVIEPGVTFRQLHAYLRDAKLPLWISPTSGPASGSIIGNALDKGAGYTPYADHWSNLCGLEVVLADGRLLGCGDGLDPRALTRYTHRLGAGPILDGLFAQSNLGIAVRAGVWLLPAPPEVRTFAVLYDSDDVYSAVEHARPLKLRNLVGSTISVANDLFTLGHLIRRPEDIGGGRRPVDADGLAEARAGWNVGCWNVCGALYGSRDSVALNWRAVEDHFHGVGGIRVLVHDAVAAHPAFAYRVDLFSGVPSEQELELYGLHRHGASLYLLPALRFLGQDARKAVEISRRILGEFDLDYTVEFLCATRSVRNAQPIIFDQSDPDSRDRASRAYRKLVSTFAEAGYPVSRQATLIQSETPVGSEICREVCTSLKGTFDPKGILSPGRYGIRNPTDGR
jgi:4-cresol dehydrogenase (hydroxylating)